MNLQYMYQKKILHFVFVFKILPIIFAPIYPGNPVYHRPFTISFSVSSSFGHQHVMRLETAQRQTKGFT